MGESPPAGLLSASLLHSSFLCAHTERLRDCRRWCRRMMCTVRSNTLLRPPQRPNSPANTTVRAYRERPPKAEGRGGLRPLCGVLSLSFATDICRPLRRLTPGLIAGWLRNLEPDTGRRTQDDMPCVIGTRYSMTHKLIKRGEAPHY